MHAELTSFFSNSKKQNPLGTPFFGPTQCTITSINVIFPKGSNNFTIAYLF
jgi:hypothetical protein